MGGKINYKYMTIKKTILWISGAVALLQVFLMTFSYSSFFDSCYNNFLCRDNFLNWVKITAPYLHLFLPLFLFSLITYFLRQEIARAWAYLALGWTLLSMILIYLAPEYGSGGFGPSISFDKGFYAFVLMIFFSVISLLVIIFGYIILRLRGK